MCQLHIHQPTADAFADRMVDVLNNGALALMTSIGHRTGLFDTMAQTGPTSVDELADTAKLNERYVREWLGAMVTGGFVNYSADTERYTLPREHASVLTRDAAPDNVAAFTQYIGLLGSVEDKIVDCFYSGGGVPYADYPRFQDVMAEDSGQTVLPALIDNILPMVPGLPGELEKGIDVLDIGCGSGKALNLMAAAYPASRFTGYDISEGGIARAQEQADANGLANLTFQVRDVTKLDGSETFDLITAFDAIHDQRDPATVLQGIHRSLRPTGAFLMQDIAGSSEVQKNKDHPIGPFLYTVSCMHCMTVSLAEGGAGLGAMWGEELALEMLRKAGFGSVQVQQLPHDIQNSYYVATPG
jgi:SAM-dependent methyltransferase